MFDHGLTKRMSRVCWLAFPSTSCLMCGSIKAAMSLT